MADSSLEAVPVEKGWLEKQELPIKEWVAVAKGWYAEKHPWITDGAKVSKSFGDLSLLNLGGRRSDLTTAAATVKPPFSDTLATPHNPFSS
jgi:hypothetical protein